MEGDACWAHDPGAVSRQNGQALSWPLGPSNPHCLRLMFPQKPSGLSMAEDWLPVVFDALTL